MDIGIAKIIDYNNYGDHLNAMNLYVGEFRCSYRHTSSEHCMKRAVIYINRPRC